MNNLSFKVMKMAVDNRKLVTGLASAAVGAAVTTVGTAAFKIVFNVHDYKLSRVVAKNGKIAITEEITYTNTMRDKLHKNNLRKEGKQFQKELNETVENA